MIFESNSEDTDIVLWPEFPEFGSMRNPKLPILKSVSENELLGIYYIDGFAFCECNNILNFAF